jgi:hypothetical protein
MSGASSRSSWRVLSTTLPDWGEAHFENWMQWKLLWKLAPCGSNKWSYQLEGRRYQDKFFKQTVLSSARFNVNIICKDWYLVNWYSAQILLSVVNYYSLPCLSTYSFCGTRVWTQCLGLARQVLYHLSNSSSPCYFSNRGLGFCLGWSLQCDLLTSTHW